MIEAVSTASVQSQALREAPQGSPVFSAPAKEAPASFMGSRIRIDNLLDLAILEFRASETGDVIRQYPSESQIRAFQRAAELEVRRTESRQAEAPVVSEAPTADAAPVTVTPAPQPAQPTVSAPVSVDVPDSSGAEATSTQSVVV